MEQPMGRPSPVKLEVEYPEQSSRGLALCTIFAIKALILLPVIIVLYIFEIAVAVSMLVGLLAVVFTGKYPKGLFDFNVRFMKWMMEVNVYMLSMSDKYPPFAPM